MLRRRSPLFIALLLSCADPASLAHEGGEFLLVSLDGQPLPAPRDPDSTCVEYVTAGRYSLAPTRDTAEARFQLEEDSELRCGALANADSSTLEATYFVKHDTLRFRSHPTSAVMWRGVRHGDTLVIQQDHFFADFVGRSREYRYVRRTTGP